MTDGRDYNEAHTTATIVTSHGESISIAARTRRRGDDVIVFMHGLGCSKEFYAGAFEAEVLQDFSLCAFDFPSHGASQVVDPVVATIERYADVARAFIRTLEPARVVLVCHSLGGAVGLLAVGALGNCADFISVEGNLVGEDCGLVSRGIAGQSQAEFVAFNHAILADDLRLSDDHVSQFWAGWFQRADPAGLHALARSLVDWSDSGRLLEHVARGGFRYFHGERSDVNHLIRHLDGVPQLSIPGAGHFPMLDNPGAFYAAVAAVASAAWRRG